MWEGHVGRVTDIQGKVKLFPESMQFYNGALYQAVQKIMHAKTHKIAKLLQPKVVDST